MKPGTRKRAAEALAEYYSSPHPRKQAFSETCAKYEIRSRTLQRWLRDIDNDTELARQVNELRAKATVAFSERLAQTKQKFLDGLEKSYEELKTNTADVLRAKSEALRTIADIERTDLIASTYLNSAAQSAVGRIEASGPRVLLIADGESSDEADDHVPEVHPAAEAGVEGDREGQPSNAVPSVG